MTPEAKEALAVVDARRADLMAAATNDQVRVKLGNLHEVCRILVVDAAQRPTVPEVVRRYAARFVAREQSLAEQSLRNKRAGANPYAALYEAWVGAAEFLLAPRRRRGQPSIPGEMLTTDDIAGIASIDDVPLRHQVGLMLAQNRSLKAQIDILKDVRNAPVLRIEGAADGGVARRQSIPLATHLALTETEVEAVRDFVDARLMRARGLRDAEDGSVETMDGCQTRASWRHSTRSCAAYDS